jgi:uncharacterized phage protein (TIGR02218 family)
MATFDTQEMSMRGGKPVFLYRFNVGTTSWRFTDADQIFTLSSEDYTPEPGLRATGTSQSKEVNAQRIVISAGKDWLIPRMFVSFVPATTMNLVIYKLHRDAPTDAYVFWQGIVRDGKFDGKKTSIDCDPLLMMLNRLGLRETFGPLCSKILYDGFCPVPRSSFRVDGTLSIAPSGFTLDAPEWAGQPDGWFVSGEVERVLPSGVIDRRFIIGHTTTTLTILSPFPPDLEGGEVIRAYAGCDHLMSTCSGKFGAFTDTGGAFAGWERVPNKNLFQTGLENPV